MLSLITYQQGVCRDHVMLFFHSISFPVIDPHGKKIQAAPTEEFFSVWGPDPNFHNQRLMSPTFNVYKTKDGRYYHIHGTSW